jgi:hypothetical protein
MDSQCPLYVKIRRTAIYPVENTRKISANEQCGVSLDDGIVVETCDNHFFWGNNGIESTWL